MNMKTNLHGDVCPQPHVSHNLFVLPQLHFQSPFQEIIAGWAIDDANPRAGGILTRLLIGYLHVEKHKTRKNKFEGHLVLEFKWARAITSSDECHRNCVASIIFLNNFAGIVDTWHTGATYKLDQTLR